jgi:hypothetical protein
MTPIEIKKLDFSVKLVHGSSMDMIFGDTSVTAYMIDTEKVKKKGGW